MSISRLRIIVSVVVLMAYLLTLIVLAVGASALWIKMAHAIEVGRAIVPLLSGYVAAIIGYYFTERRRRARGRPPAATTVPRPIARIVLLAVILVCASVPISVLMKCLNFGPLAGQAVLINVLAAEQSVMAGLIGVLISALLGKEDAS